MLEFIIYSKKMQRKVVSHLCVIDIANEYLISAQR